MTTSIHDWKSYVSPTEVGDIVRADFAVEGVHCAGCMNKIENGVGRIAGVQNARLNLTTHRLAVEWNQYELKPDVIIEVLDSMGYQAYPFDPKILQNNVDKTSRELLKAVAVSGFAATNIMLLSISVWSGNVTDITPETRSFFHWLSALIALPAVAYSGRTFFVSAFNAIRNRSLNMDVPISVGVTMALFLSIIQTIQHAEHAYFDSAIMLVFFLLVGRYLDQNMRKRTRSFAENLAALRADSATKVLPDGSIKKVPLTRIDPGEIVLVETGDRIPVDGVVVNGNSEIDQSLITGETMLSKITVGDHVFAGTLNVGGSLRVQVSASTQGTLLDEVNQLLETATQAKSSYVRLVDKVASYYAPVVHCAAIITFLGWLFWGGDWQQSLVIAISVLIITCPCALGLAIPTVQVVVCGLLYRNGVLLNSGDAIERLAQVDTIIFDKTGTLTQSNPSLVNLESYSNQVLTQAARLAQSSRHPLAKSLASFSTENQVYESVQEISGAGVETKVDGRMLRLGSAEFCGVSSTAIAEFKVEHPSASVLVYVEEGSEPVIFLFEQKLREDAPQVVSKLKQMGYKLLILSGDHNQAVQKIAKQVGIKHYKSSQKPQDKVALIEEIKTQGHHVLMVGDGLNDAPSLAAASVSLSPISAVQLSQASADGVFISEKLMPVKYALEMAFKARRTMSGNLLLSGIYNVIAIPIAVLGFVTPLIAALAMSGSSIIVTANALRLRYSSNNLDVKNRATE